MSIHTEKLDGLPVILGTFSGYISIEDFEQMFRETVPLLVEPETQYYFVNDIRESTTAFTDFIKIFDSAIHRRTSHVGGPLPQLMFVGMNDWIDNFCHMMQKQRGVNIPVFHDIEEAIHFVEQDMKKHIL